MDSGNIGEKYIHLEFLRLGFEHVYLANSSQQKDWDIAFFKKRSEDNSYNLIKLQVKTKDWNSRKSSSTINGKFNSDFHYLIIVILNYSEEDPYLIYLIPRDKIKNSKYSSKGKYILFDEEDNTIQFTNETITLNKFDEFKLKFDKYFQWSLLIEDLKS
jgi:hypothetical protein